MDNVQVKKFGASWISHTGKGFVTLEMSPFDVVNGWTFGASDAIQFHFDSLTVDIPSRNDAPAMWSQKKGSVFTYKDKDNGIVLTMDLSRKKLGLQLRNASLLKVFNSDMTVNFSIGIYAVAMRLNTSRKIILKSN